MSKTHKQGIYIIVLSLIPCFVRLSLSFTVNPNKNILSKRSTKIFSSKEQSLPNLETIDNEGTAPITVIAGATGYIGRAVVRESVARGFNTIALIRDVSRLSTDEGKAQFGEAFEGAKIIQCDVESVEELNEVFSKIEGKIDTVISCLASRSGVKKEAYAIDYQATLNCLEAGKQSNARHFVLLSAFCVRNPLLQLQQAKLKFEAALTSQTDLSWSIVRPTAFFKSVSGQLEGIQQGAPYVLFGDGAVTRCNPISEQELAQFMINCIDDTSKHGKIMNIGGPDEPLTNKMLGEMMYQAINKEAKFVYAPTWIFDLVISLFQFIANISKSEAMEDAVEVAKIGKYYAVEDMLTTEPEEKFGSTKMQDHYDKIASDGQDPFTPVRATAVISRVLEAGPALAISLPALFLTLKNPQVIEQAVLNPTFLLANLGL